MIRWFEDDRLGFAFGCVFATGEFGGALAFYFGWFLSKEYTDGYITVFLIGGGLSAVALCCLLVTWWLDRANHRAAVRQAERSHIHRSARDYMHWTVSVVQRQTTMFWLCFFQVMCFYTGFYTFVSFTADFLVQCYHLDLSRATLYSGIPCGFSLLLSPLSGYLLDKYGYRNQTSTCHAALCAPVVVCSYCSTLFSRSRRAVRTVRRRHGHHERQQQRADAGTAGPVRPRVQLHPRLHMGVLRRLVSGERVCDCVRTLCMCVQRVNRGISVPSGPVDDDGRGLTVALPVQLALSLGRHVLWIPAHHCAALENPEADHLTGTKPELQRGAFNASFNRNAMFTTTRGLVGDQSVP